MKKYFTIFYTCMLTAIIAQGSDGLPVKGSLTGTVTDAETGLPLQAATVFITDMKVGSSTNAKGEFYLNNISGGTHLVEVSYIGYTTIAMKVFIDGETRADFKLQTSIVESDAVIVTGVSKASQLKKIPFQVSVIRKEELQQTSATNIIEALSRKAGVSSLSTGPAIAKPLIRGLGYNRVLTINDGVRQEGQQWGDEHGIEIDEASVSKVEILKGPASLIYGSDAMAGVINIITNVPVQANTLIVNAGSQYQTNSRLRALYGNVAGNVNGISWNAYGTLKASADYKNKYDGYVFNSKFKEQNAGGYVGINRGWGYSHLVFSNFNLRAGLIEGERDDEGFFVKVVSGGGQARAISSDFRETTPSIPYQFIRHSKVALDNNFKINQNRLSVNVGWQRNQREEFGNADDIHERSLHFDLGTVTYNAQFHFKESRRWKNSFGINGMRQENENRGVEQLIPDYKLNDVGVFGYFQKEAGKNTFSGGIRYDNRHLKAEALRDVNAIKGAAFAKTFSNISGSLGMTHQFDKSFNLKLNLARAFRAPSIPELASNGAHEGTTRYEYGEVNLKSEVSYQADAALEFNNPHFSVNLAGYHNSFNNYIFYSRLASVAGLDSTVMVDGEELAAFKFNQRRATVSGIEATLDIHPHPLDWLHLQNSFSMVSGKLAQAIEGIEYLPFIPGAKLLTELRADFKKATGPYKNFYVKFEIENNFKQLNAFTAYNTETVTGAYTLLHAGVGVEFANTSGGKLFSLNLSANNIADIAYQSHLSRLKYAAINNATGRQGVFNMGRNFGLRVNVPLSYKLK